MMLESHQRPTCKSCARYAGMTSHKRRGTYCVLCRATMHDTTLRPYKGPRAKNVDICTDYIPKQTLTTMMVIA